MGFSHEASTYTSLIIKVYDVNHHLVHLNDDIVASPLWSFGAGGAGAGAHLGNAIRILAEENLKLGCYLLARHHVRIKPARHHVRIKPRRFDPSANLKTAMRTPNGLRSTSGTGPTPSKLLPHHQAIEDYLAKCLGTTGITLACVIRDEEEIPINDPSNGYETPQLEMIALATGVLTDQLQDRTCETASNYAEA